MITTRALPPEEWSRLDGTLLGATYPHLSPDATVMVVERDGVIVGCTALFQQWHLEGTWIADAEHRNAAIGRALLRAMRAALEASNVREVCMMATTPETSALCAKMGPSLKLEADHFVMTVGDR